MNTDRQRCEICPFQKNVTVQGHCLRPITPGGLMIIGEAPGEIERGRGLPFVGQSGQLLRGALTACGVDPKDVYFTNAVICFPTGNATPTREMIAGCAPHLYNEILKVRPRKILAVGATALAALSREFKTLGITKTRGIGMMLQIEDLEVYVVPTYHPAYILRDPDAFRDFALDIQKWASNDAPMPMISIETTICSTPQEVIWELEALREASTVSCDIESSGLSAFTCDLWSVGFGALTAEGTGYAVIIPRELLSLGRVRQEVIAFFKEFTGELVFHNGKFDLLFLWEWFGEQVTPQHIKDTMLLSYCGDERQGGHSLKTLSRTLYDIPDYHFDFDAFSKVPDAQKDWARLYGYHAIDVVQTARLSFDLPKKLEEESPELPKLHDLIYAPGTIQLARAEHRGILIDHEHLQNLEGQYLEKVKGIEAVCFSFIREHGGKVTNLNSPVQMVTFLFDVLKLPPPRTTEKEAMLFLTTKVDEPTKRFIETFLDYRLYFRVLGTYVKGLLDRRDENGRIHPTHKMHGTRTGRLSCEEPNTQNIPTLMGPDIRMAFRASPGFYWVDADESQLELRVAAHLSQDEAMIQAYRDKRDIHREVASKMFNKPPKEITDYERYLAKYVDFGVIYQRGAYAVANGWEMTYYELKYHQPKWTVEQAQFFIDEFLGGFPGLLRWIEGQKARVDLEYPFVETPTGFRRRAPLILPKMRGEVERQFVNSPIQGFASHITFSALARIQEDFHRYWPGKAFVLMTVHDSIGMEIHESLLEEVNGHWKGDPLDIIHQHMETAPVPFTVPLKADIKVGRTWGGAEKE